MIFLRAVSKKRKVAGLDRFPFSVPIVQSLDRLEFRTPVTLLVGENGTGKSTLLEAIALAVKAVTVGSDDVDRDASLAHVRALADGLAQTWNRRAQRGFFLRAEDFFGYARRVARLREEARLAIDHVDREYADRSDWAKVLAKGPHNRTIHELTARYGEGLDAQSHGESFLALFQSRLVPRGLYLLDEPEVPLSPLRQLSLISLIKEMEQQECQFVIATHSPILLAYPGATILSCDRDPIAEVAYEDLEHVRLTKEFLDDPARFLDRL